MVDKITENFGIQRRPQIIGITDKGILVAGVQQYLQHTCCHQCGVEITVAGRTPLLIGVIWPFGRRKIPFAYFRHLMLQEVERHILEKIRVLDERS